MNARCTLRGLGVFAIVLIGAFAAFPAGARGGGHGGGGHGGGGSHASAFRGGARAGYGLRGGYGYRGGWRGYGYYGGWGWGGLGYGVFFGALPFYYSTMWWNGVPYYYADGDYYMWNGAVSAYETVPPPLGLEGQAAQQPSVTNLFAYPKNGQSAEQQASDRYECHRWAKDQTGFDPTQSGGVAAADSTTPGAATPAPSTVASPAMRQDYVRAQTACLEGRGYSVR